MEKAWKCEREDRRDFSFPHLYLVERVEQWKDEKNFVWFKKKKMRG